MCICDDSIDKLSVLQKPTRAFKLNTHTQTRSGLISTGASLVMLLHSKTMVLNLWSFGSHLFLQKICVLVFVGCNSTNSIDKLSFLQKPMRAGHQIGFLSLKETDQLISLSMSLSCKKKGNCSPSRIPPFVLKGLRAAGPQQNEDDLSKKCKAWQRWHLHKQGERRESSVSGPDPDCFYYADHIGEGSLHGTATEQSWILTARTWLFTSEQSGQRDPYEIQSTAGHKSSARGCPTVWTHILKLRCRKLDRHRDGVDVTARLLSSARGLLEERRHTQFRSEFHLAF